MEPPTGSLPLTPGGTGILATSVVATLVRLGAGSGAVPGYRIFSFWLPIPPGAGFHPTLHGGTSTRRLS